MKLHIKLRAFLLGSSSLLAASALHAAPVTWDITPGTVGTGDSAVTGGAGTWNTTNGNWTVDSGVNNLAWVNGSDTAVFGSAGGIVTIDTGGVTVGGLQFDIAGYTLSGDILTFGTAGNIAANANATISSVVAGGVAIDKTGTGTLTLSGPNTYSGGTTLNGTGAVIISNVTSFGAGDVLVTGPSRINATGSLIYANKIDVGATLSLQIPSAVPTTAEFTGVLSGSSDINLINSVSGNNQTNLYFSNAINTFTGSVIGPAGNANGADYFKFNSIGDGGNFTFNKAGNRGGVIYSGASAIEFNTRQLAIGTSFGGGGTYGVNGNNAPQNAFQNNATDPAHTVTFKADMAMTSISSSSVFYFDGSNTGNNTFAGIIADPTGVNTLSIGKSGTGKWLLTGANSFEGNAFIANGTLSVNTLDIAANNQSLGKGSLILLGFINTNGTLEFTGSAASTTDKQVQVGNPTATHTGGGSILNNGSGSLTFSNATFNSSAGNISATRTVTLGGSHTGAANEIQGIIQNNVGTGKVALTVSGSTWTLSGANTYTGITTITGGTLLIKGNQTLATGAVAVNGTSTLGGNGTIGGSVTVAAAANIAPGASVGTLSIGGNLTLSAMAGGTGTLNFELATLAASDKIAVGGTLAIGTDVLDFADFNFTALAGLQNGTYKLITSGAAVSGTLDPIPANLTGPVGSGTGTLQITGNDIELVVSGIGGGSLYATFSGGAPFDGDANGDGVSNGLAFLLGAANINVSALDKLPTVMQSGGGLVLNFTTLNGASRGAATLNVQHSSDLGISDPWVSAPVPDSAGASGPVNGVSFNVSLASPSNSVTATISSSEAAAGKLFARLRATEN